MAVGVLAVVAIFSLSTPSTRPVEVRLVHTEELRSRGSKAITVEFERSGSGYVSLDEDLKMQLRIANRWQEAQKLPPLHLWEETNRQDVVFAVPSEAQACRLLVGYRVYRKAGRPYCRAYFFGSSGITR